MIGDEIDGDVAVVSTLNKSLILNDPFFLLFLFCGGDDGDKETDEDDDDDDELDETIFGEHNSSDVVVAFDAINKDISVLLIFDFFIKFL
jgi:hypothetical protein